MDAVGATFRECRERIELRPGRRQTAAKGPSMRPAAPARRPPRIRVRCARRAAASPTWTSAPSRSPSAGIGVGVRLDSRRTPCEPPVRKSRSRPPPQPDHEADRARRLVNLPPPPPRGPSRPAPLPGGGPPETRLRPPRAGPRPSSWRSGPARTPGRRSSSSSLPEWTPTSRRTSKRPVNVTALMVASGAGREEIVRRLRESGANPVADPSGDAALMYAASAGWPAVLRYLLRMGADVNHANRRGETALLLSIPAPWPQQDRDRALDCINQLLAAGAHVDGRWTTARRPFTPRSGARSSPPCACCFCAAPIPTSRAGRRTLAAAARHRRRHGRNRPGAASRRGEPGGARPVGGDPGRASHQRGGGARSAAPGGRPGVSGSGS